MPKCTHRGCEKEYDEASNDDNACVYHSQGPIFHEGLKGWTCCSKRVVDFDEFMKIPGCTTGRHSSEPLPAPPPKAKEEVPSSSQPRRRSSLEVYSNGATIQLADHVPPPKTVAEAVDDIEEKPAIPEVPEEDDLTVTVAPGTTCKRRGCGVQYVNDATSRGEGSQAQCQYHPGAPVFHEGSKGWSCCTRKVLEFEEFLKIKGCRTGNHLFVGSSNANTSQLVDCRQDWYQTPTHVIITFFAKKADKDQSKVILNRESLSVDLRMPDGKVFKKSLALFQPIDVENSSINFFGTKVEISLKKSNGFSWATLEPSSNITSFTSFGVQGGTGGTVGGKEMYIATDTPLHILKH